MDNTQLPAEANVQDLEAVILARVYRLILAWPDPPNETTSGEGVTEDVGVIADNELAEANPDEEVKR